MSAVVTALGILGKLVATPIANAAQRKEVVQRALKAAKLDASVPAADFETLYAVTLIEYCVGRSDSVLAVFRDAHVRDSFRRSFHDHDWTRLRREVAEAVERNRESGEFGHLEHNFTDQTDGFVAKFNELVNRSRTPAEVQNEKLLKDIKGMLAQVALTRDHEEEHRLLAEPRRAELTAAQRLAEDVREWFGAVGYAVRSQWTAPDGSETLLVDIPRARPGRFDLTVVLCVEGELGPHHMAVLGELAERHRADEGWGIARVRVSSAARQAAEGSGDRLYACSFDDVIDLVADFEPYLAWVEEEARQRGVDTRYVPLSCTKEEVDPATGKQIADSRYDWRDGGLDDYVARWLEDPAKQHLSLLGEFGTGKSWFSLHLAYTMVRAWRDAKRRGVPRPRVPLLITLRDYAKQTRVQGLLAEFFFDKHKVNLRNSDVVRLLNRMGRLLLVFDGFDEMAARTDRNTVVANFWELATVVEPGSKVLLSSRKEHFRHAQEARELFGAKVGAPLVGSPADGPVFDIVDLVPFDDEQVERLLSFSLSGPQVRMVTGHPEVRELMRRPVMAELVVEALPEIEQGAEIDLARIYLYAVRRKMDRDIRAERTFTSRADKLFFLCEVAWEMHSSQRLTLNYRDFPDHLRSCFGPVVHSAKDLDHWEQDMRNQGMLVRNAEGDYGPSHRSLLEFLVAFKLAAELGLLADEFLAAVQSDDPPSEAAETWTWSEYFAARSPQGALPALAGFVPEQLPVLAAGFGRMDRNWTVFQLLAAIVRLAPDYRVRLWELARARADEGTGPIDGLAAKCLTLIVIAGGSLEGLDLRGMSLYGLGFDGAGPRYSLAGADLRDAWCLGTDVLVADLAGADLRGARAVEGLMEDDQCYRRNLWVTSSGVTVVDDDRALHWPDGRLSQEPTCLWRAADGRARPQLWDDRTLWLGGVLLDLRTGREIGTTAVTDPSLVPCRHEGRQLLRRTDSAFPPRFLFTDPGSGLPTGELVIPYPEDSYTVVMTNDRGGPSAVLLTGTAMRYTVADGPAPKVWRTVAEVPLGFDKDSHFSSRVNSFGALVQVDGRLVAVVDAVTTTALLDPAGLPVPYLDGIDRIDAFAFHALSGLAAVTVGTLLYAWQPSESATEPLWQVGLPSRATGLYASPDGALLTLLLSIGELWQLDLRTGAVVGRAPLTDRLRGARFSRNCDLGEEVLAAVVRLGAVVEE
ncbi:NACHT domain-containing protein [Kitasatospora phosalacinea]|uniref:NACHT domain-containing protein n=1 Tax=Kitasatospora phosalacinea TaxID=2065 RepID=A0ABW6GK58_9ACTN